jgi:hypothetical protein
MVLLKIEREALQKVGLAGYIEKGNIVKRNFEISYENSWMVLNLARERKSLATPVIL